MSSMPRLRATLLALLATLPFMTARAQPRVPDPPEVVRQILARANDFRRTQGLAPLASEPRLTAAAHDFADYLARTDRFAHDADGRTPPQRASAAGYDWCTVAENLALEASSAGFESGELAKALMEGWIASPGHRRNLLKADVTQSGIAIAHSARSDRWYAVQMFGRPGSERITFDMSNRSDRTVTYRVGDDSAVLASGTRRTDQTCGTSEVELVLPGQPPLRLHPRDGTHYRIEATPGGLQVSGE